MEELRSSFPTELVLEPCWPWAATTSSTTTATRTPSWSAASTPSPPSSPPWSSSPSSATWHTPRVWRSEMWSSLVLASPSWFILRLSWPLPHLRCGLSSSLSCFWLWELTPSSAEWSLWWQAWSTTGPMCCSHTGRSSPWPWPSSCSSSAYPWSPGTVSTSSSWWTSMLPAVCHSCGASSSKPSPFAGCLGPRGSMDVLRRWLAIESAITG